MANKFEWSNETNERFKKLYLEKDIDEVCEEFSLTKQQVYNRARTLGIRRIDKPARRYTPDEEDLFIKMYPSASWDDLIKTFGRSKEQMAHKAKSLGICRLNVAFSAYSELEDALLRQHYDTLAPDEIHENYLPHRTVSSIKNHCMELGLRRGVVIWTPEKIAELATVYENNTIDDTAAIMGLTRDQAYCAIIKHGLKSNNRFRRRYTDEELSFIKDNYLVMSDKELGDAIGRGANTIKNTRNTHGWHRPARVASVRYDSIYQYVRKNNAVWFKESRKAGENKCFITGESHVAVHHLYGLHMILDEALEELGMLHVKDMGKDYAVLSDEELRSILQVFKKHQSKYPLGICVTKDIHKQFHSEYGYGRNTPQQFQEFVQSNYPSALDFYYAHLAA